MTKGLVLAGGGAKGSYQVGVYKALDELDWRPGVIAGTSVGCLNGALFALDDWELALRFIAASGACDIIIPGMGSPEEVDRNAAVDLTAPLTEEERARCEAIRKELGGQFCRRCGYCAPCSTGIDIPSCFLMANYTRKYCLADWAKARYKAMTYHASSCVQCGACEKRCPYGLPIRDMLGDVAKVFGY